MDVTNAPPAYGRTPFPSDAVRGDVTIGPIAGLERMTPGQPDLIAQHLGALDGFGLRPVVEFFIQGDIDPATVPATTSALTDALVLVDVDPNSPAHGTAYAMDWKWDGDRHEIVGSPHPGTQLFEGTRYAAVLTTDVRAPSGAHLYAPTLYQLAHDPPARWKSTAAAYAELDGKPELAHRIAGIAVFTTEHASDALIAARSAIASTTIAPAPTLAFADPSIIFDSPTRLDALLGRATRDTTGPRAGLEIWGNDNPTGWAHDHVAVVATGTTTIVRFKGPDDGTNGPTSKTFQIGPGGVPAIQSIDTIPITFVLPNTPMPAGGYPVVIYGHGLGGSRADVMEIAEPIAAQGYALVAIDMWGHGSRYDATDTGNNFASGKPSFTGDPSLRDGFGDDVGYAEYIAFFENFLNITAIRDTIRQSALDFTRVATLIQTHPDLSALAGAYGGVTPVLDATRVAYIGVSFGTLVGTELSAIEPSVDLFVLDVPGGGLLDEIMPNSPTIGTLALPIAQEIYRTTGTLDRFHPLVGAMQAVIDGADPLTYAPHVLRERFRIAGQILGRRHVICIEAIDDEIMSNPATDALARAYGMGVLVPDLDPPAGVPQLPSPASANVDDQTAVLVQYSPATHGNNLQAQHGELDYQPGFPFPGDNPFPKLATPIQIDEPIYQTQAQVAQILATHFASGGAPVVVTTETPVPPP